MSTDFGNLQTVLSSISRDGTSICNELALTLMNLEDAYRDGYIGRTVINGFNTKLENCCRAIWDNYSQLNELVMYAQNHIPNDKFKELDKNNDWFRKHQVK